MDEMTLMLVGVAVVAAVLGFAGGWFMFGGGKGAKAKASELQEALDAAQEEMTDYKQEVYDQFSDTADKFRALDKSYQDLHRQLAASSVALVGDVGSSLLTHDGADAALTTDAEASGSEIEPSVDDEASADIVASDAEDTEVDRPEVEVANAESSDASGADSTVVAEDAPETTAADPSTDTAHEHAQARVQDVSVEPTQASDDDPESGEEPPLLKESVQPSRPGSGG